MPALRDLLQLVYEEAEQSGCEIPDALRTSLEQSIRKTWPEQRVYIAKPDSQRDPNRKDRIRRRLARLPVKVVAKLEGVTPSRVYQVARPKK